MTLGITTNYAFHIKKNIMNRLLENMRKILTQQENSLSANYPLPERYKIVCDEHYVK